MVLCMRLNVSVELIEIDLRQFNPLTLQFRWLLLRRYRSWFTTRRFHCGQFLSMRETVFDVERSNKLDLHWRALEHQRFQLHVPESIGWIFIWSDSRFQFRYGSPDQYGEPNYYRLSNYYFSRYVLFTFLFESLCFDHVFRI